MQPIQVLFSSPERAYTGVELRPHFLLTELGLRGSGVGAFSGPCHVVTEHLVDWEDRLVNDRIEARSMIHFIGEFFGMTLREAVVRQRLLMATINQQVNLGLRALDQNRLFAERHGDDIFVADRKLSVSIVTASPVSMLLHTGINIDPAGAPVPAIGLAELGLLGEAGEGSMDARRAWAETVLKAFAEEWESMEWACAKVRPVM